MKSRGARYMIYFEYHEGQRLVIWFRKKIVYLFLELVLESG